MSKILWGMIQIAYWACKLFIFINMLIKDLLLKRYKYLLLPKVIRISNYLNIMILMLNTYCKEKNKTS